MKNAGLQSGSREICSPTKLWSFQIRFKNFRFKKELTSRKIEFKGCQKISGSKWRMPVCNPAQGKSVLPQSFEALNIGFKIPVQEEFISCKKLKVVEEDLQPWCVVQTWVSCLIGLSCVVTWGLLFIKRRLVYPLIQLIKVLYKNHLRAWLHLNHSYTSWSAQCHSITWGLGRIQTIATPLDRRNATASLGGLVVSEP